MAIFLSSERYGPNGGVSASGVRNQLGRPKLDPLAVLVRESVQNSWDARVDSRGSITCGISGWDLNEDQSDVLRNIVFGHRPQSLPLSDVLETARPLRLLAVYDRGTEGLTGPTRADAPVLDHAPRNFVDFIRNVGQPPDKKFGGGTYGYGKAIFYNRSVAQTIMVHTRCEHSGELESRWLAAALGTNFVNRGVQYTGRHWWGRQEDDVAEPYLNDVADQIASRLGFPTMSASATGTTIVLVQPDFGEYAPYDAMCRMTDYLLWYFWPKMIADEDSGLPPIHFEASWNGNAVPISSPELTPPLDGFVRAYKRLKRHEPDDQFGRTIKINLLSPKRALGILSVEKFQRRSHASPGEDGTAPYYDSTHHIALMRQAELVVKYLEVQELPSDVIDYAGVFITDPEADSVFANAEPPTHDDWVRENLTNSTHRSMIKVAYERIRDKCKEFALPVSEGASGSQGNYSLAGFAKQFGDFLAGVDGRGVRSILDGTPMRDGGLSRGGGIEPPSTSKKPSTKGTARPRVSEISTGTLALDEQRQPTLSVEFSLSIPPSVEQAVLIGIPNAVVDSGSFEDDAPAGALKPRVVAWFHHDSGRYWHDADRVNVVPELSGRWTIWTTVVPDSTTGLELRVETGGSVP